MPLPVSATEQKYSVTLVFFLILFEVKLSAAQHHQKLRFWVCFLKTLNKVELVRG